MKAFVIRLKGIESSESLADECVKTGKDHGIDIEKFDGIFGQGAIDKHTTMLGIKPWKKNIKKGRLGVKGCFLSHYTLWLKCIELNEPLVIFEQDAMILNPIPTDIHYYFDEFLMLDPFNKFNKNYYLKHQESINNNQKIVEYFNPDSRKKYSIDTEYAMGTHAYIIKPEAAKKLKTTVKETGYYPADMQCNKGIINLQTVTQPIASVNKKYYDNIALMAQESSTQKKW